MYKSNPNKKSYLLSIVTISFSLFLSGCYFRSNEIVFCPACFIASGIEKEVTCSSSPEKAAQCIIEGSSYGNTGWDYKWGDKLIDPLTKKTNNFNNLNPREMSLLGDALSKEPSAEKIKLGYELYSRDQRNTKLIGALILARAELLEDSAFNSHSFMTQMLQDALNDDLQGEYLGIIMVFKIAAAAKSKESLPYLIKLLEEKKLPKFTVTPLIKALGEMGDDRAVPILITLAKSSTFRDCNIMAESLANITRDKMYMKKIPRQTPWLQKGPCLKELVMPSYIDQHYN